MSEQSFKFQLEALQIILETFSTQRATSLFDLT